LLPSPFFFFFLETKESDGNKCATIAFFYWCR
jgi:hypothetical protein